MLAEVTIIKTSVQKFRDVPRYCQVVLLSICDRFIPVCTKRRVKGRLAYFVR